MRVLHSYGSFLVTRFAPFITQGTTKNTTGFVEGCENSPTSGFSSLEIKWLEQAGARVIPIRYASSQHLLALYPLRSDSDSSNMQHPCCFHRYDLPRDELDYLFASINGLLYTGGSLSLLPNTTYYQTAKYLFDRCEGDRRLMLEPIENRQRCQHSFE
jgi:hypothetical protein